MLGNPTGAMWFTNKEVLGTCVGNGFAIFVQVLKEGERDSVS